MRLVVLTAAISFASAASLAATYDEFVSSFDTSAFDSADADWLRNFSNRHTDCGHYGDRKYTRAELLVSRYRTLAKAIESGNQAMILKKADSFVRTAEANPRFEKCWTRLRQNAGVASSFVRDVKSLTDA